MPDNANCENCKPLLPKLDFIVNSIVFSPAGTVIEASFAGIQHSIELSKPNEEVANEVVSTSNSFPLSLTVIASANVPVAEGFI